MEPCQIAVGRCVTVKVSATTANLGPGFDCLGLALDRYNTVTVRTTSAKVDVCEATGHGAQELPTDHHHATVRAMRHLAELSGAQLPAVHLACHNDILPGSGLGSSAAAVCAGLLAGNALLPEHAQRDVAELVHVAATLEGHPDNVAPCLLGGLTVSWKDSQGHYRAVKGSYSQDLRVIVGLPHYQGKTAQSRSLLPTTIPLGDAVANIGRTALLMHALQHDVSLLHEATQDMVHQQYRGSQIGPTLEVVGTLRAAGFAAAVSGAGPAFIVFGDDTLTAADVRPFARQPWQVEPCQLVNNASVATVQ